MLRKIVKIDEDKCNGCGLCATACAEGAIQIVDGKAKLVSDVYCDGLGACLGECPEDAITIEEREAEAFDEEAVKDFLAKGGADAAKAAPKPAPAHGHGGHHGHGGCPGMAMKSFTKKKAATSSDGELAADDEVPSGLSQWPVQLNLVPPSAPYFQNADLVICADCVAFAVGDFHQRYLAGRAIAIGCPKLDDIDHYRTKIEAILATSRPKSLTVLRMQVPCCMGIAMVAIEARNRVAPDMPAEVHVIGLQGDIIRKETLAPGETEAVVQDA